MADGFMLSCVMLSLSRYASRSMFRYSGAGNISVGEAEVASRAERKHSQ